MTPETDARTAMLRHTIATVAYRGAKVLRGAPDEFADFKLNPTTRTPAEILAHVGDLYDWALAMAQGRNDWHDSQPLPWQQETERFFRTLAAFDGYLASNLPARNASPNFGKRYSRRELCEGENCDRADRTGPDYAARGVRLARATTRS
jgi:hypothetical protein